MQHYASLQFLFVSGGRLFSRCVTFPGRNKHVLTSDKQLTTDQGNNPPHLARRAYRATTELWVTQRQLHHTKASPSTGKLHPCSSGSAACIPAVPCSAAGRSAESPSKGLQLSSPGEGGAESWKEYGNLPNPAPQAPGLTPGKGASAWRKSYLSALLGALQFDFCI